MNLQGGSSFTGRGIVASSTNSAQIQQGFQAGQTVYAQTRMNVRTGPGGGYDVFRVIDPGTPLQVVERTADGWVRVINPFGAEPPYLYVSEDLVRAQPPASGSGGGTSVGGQAGGSMSPHVGFVQANYTDIGMANGIFDEQAALEDLRRLAAAGVTNVRVWAETGGLTDIGGMANRIDVLARLAASDELHMTLTVDLIDGQGNSDLTNYTNSIYDEAINARIKDIIGPNRGHSNIVWSLGNEMQSPNQPRAFADWYAGKVQAMRDAGARKIVAELVPGAAGNNLNDADVRYAIWKITSVVDTVSIHLYPNAPPDGLEAANYDEEYALFLAWLTAANEAGKKFIVGEFAVDGGPDQDPAIRNEETLHAWLQHLSGLGVDNVFLWQFMKNEGGHIDHRSYDSFENGESFEAALRNRGWLNP
jgi:hypothetical protein